MANWFRLWEKKRGDRRTGSRIAASAGEWLFFAGLFLAGVISLAVVVGAQLRAMPEAEPYLSGWTFWLVLLVVLSFVAVGGVGMAYTLFRAGTSAERRAALVKDAAELNPIHEMPVERRPDLPGLPSNDHLTDSPGITLAYRLPISEQPGWRVFPAATFCVLWNIATAVLIIRYFTFPNEITWYITLVVLGFVAVGIWSLVYLMREMLAAANLGPTIVEVSDHPLYPGRRYEFFLSQVGQLEVQSLEVRLVCDEEATFAQGTDVLTDSRRVFSERLLRQENFRIQAGHPFEVHGEFEIPRPAMHSFQSEHNGVQWKLLVTGEIAGWPSLERAFPVIVYPEGADAAPRAVASEREARQFVV